MEAKEGSSVTLTCMAFGNPKPIVTWLREGDLLGANSKYQVGGWMGVLLGAVSTGPRWWQLRRAWSQTCFLSTSCLDAHFPPPSISADSSPHRCLPLGTGWRPPCCLGQPHSLLLPGESSWGAGCCARSWGVPMQGGIWTGRTLLPSPRTLFTSRRLPSRDSPLSCNW